MTDELPTSLQELRLVDPSGSAIAQHNVAIEWSSEAPIGRTAWSKLR
jgi:hypothetical protein